MSKATAVSALERHGLSDEQLVDMLRTMLLQRQVDNRGFQLNRQGKIPFAMGSEGHEALQAGAAAAFKRGSDVLVPYYRDLGLLLGVGVSALDLLNAMFARNDDRSGGRQFPSHISDRAKGVLSISSIIAAHLPHAVGVAAAFRYRHETGRVVLASFGDGATSAGEWHESLNYAGVHQLPVVFLCENNHFAISTPQSHQMAVEQVSDRAAGYGMPGGGVDGVDPIAAYGAVAAAMERARNGGGPSLVEGNCYRYLSHSTDDDDRTYRSRDIVQEERKNDPVPRFERVLLDAGVIGAEQLAELKRDVLRETNDATDRWESRPFPDVAELYTQIHEGAWEPWQ